MSAVVRLRPVLTGWFPPEVKPVRKGVYSVRWRGHTGYSYWDGERWGWYQHTLHRANKDRVSIGASQKKTWRGLAVNPNRRTK